MAAIPRSTITTTLALVGIGFAMVAALLIFAFSLLGRANNPPSSDSISPAIDVLPTPTPEFIPNEPLLPEGQ